MKLRRTPKVRLQLTCHSVVVFLGHYTEYLSLYGEIGKEGTSVLLGALSTPQVGAGLIGVAKVDKCFFFPVKWGFDTTSSKLGCDK